MHKLFLKTIAEIEISRVNGAKIPLLFLAIGFISQLGFSQDSQSLDSIVIQVAGLQIPFSQQNRNIEVIDQTIIKAMPVQSVDDLLSYVAGIDIRKRGVMGAQADVSINGGTFDQTLVLINGMKIVDPQTGHNMMNLPLTIDAIERIEILKGPAASFYGVNAINGAINIVTLQPKKSGVKVHAFGGSSFKRDTNNNNLYNGLGLNIDASLATEKSNHFLALGTIQSNGYRHNTDIDNNKIFYSNQMKLGRHSLKMMGGFVNNDFGANGFYAAPNDPEAKERVQTVIGGIEGNVRMSDFWTFKPRLTYRYGADHFILDKNHPKIYENKHSTNVFGTTLNNVFFSGIGTFRFGLELRHAKIRSNSLGNHARNNIGIFGNYQFDRIAKTSIDVGMYVNKNNDFGWDWMPSVDVGYQLHKNLRGYANFGTGLRLPTYTDLYYTSPTNIGNEDLNPEESWQTAVGLKYRKTNLNASAEYFYRNTENFIDWVRDSISHPWQSQNYHNIKMQGISIAADYRIYLDEKSINNSLLAAVSYTYLNPTVKQGSSTKLSHYALENLQHQLTGRLNMQFLHRFEIGLSGKYQKRITDKDYFLLAARVATQIDDFLLYIDGDNLTNIQYTETAAVPMPGRWITLGVKWKWRKG